MKEPQPVANPHPGSQDVYAFCEDGESLERLQGDALLGEKGTFGGNANSAADNGAQSRKKRKRCGVCIPCLRKEPCGECYNCVNRSTSHQICKMRKCEELKKKRLVPLKGTEAENKDSPKIQGKVHSVKNCSEIVPFDGPITGQMETGPVNHVEEGRLKQECDLALLNKGCEGLEDRLLMEANQWLSNASAPQESEKLSWDNPSIHNHTAANNNSSNLEDAKNLVAFSAVAEAMSSYGIPASGTPSLLSMQLYEQFNYETNRANSGHQESKAPSCPGDLNTLKAALTLAKHGMKPPNCNCDGPECPDYLDWLENKIKTAIKSHPDSANHSSSQVNQQLMENNYPAEQVLALENKIAKCPLGTLPFSQNALSIAKEKNISLQTAIAIEALTQLSSALPQEDKESPNSSLQQPLVPHEQLTHFTSAKGNEVLPMACSELFQDAQSQLYTGKNALHVSQSANQNSWEQHNNPNGQERQYIPDNISQGSSTLLSRQTPTPQKTEFLEQWVPNSEHLKSPSDPMTGLKQLIGNADDYMKSVFKGPEALPNRIKNVKSKQNSVNSIKKEPGLYKISPNHQLSQVFQESDIHQNTQAALQQHLHHKRNLFLDNNNMQAKEQPDWWVPNTQQIPPLKQEKPIKERKKRVQSPSQKQGEPKPKPQKKQVQIKKPRQKDASAVFLPVNQISLEGLRRPASVENHVKEMVVDQSLPNDIKPMLLTPQSLQQTVLQANVDNRRTVNTQEMCSVSQSNTGQASDLALCIPQTNSINPKNICPTPSTDDTSSSSGQGDSTSERTNANQIPVQNDLSSIDDKFEDLIRQFEAEFGDDFSFPTSVIPSQNGEVPSKPPVDSQVKLPSPSNTLPAENTAPLADHSNSALSNTSASQDMLQNFENLFSARSPKQIKIESSGAITVVSTTCFYSEENHLDETPTKSELPFNPTLSGFLESPLKYLDSPTKSLLDTPAKRAQAEFPTCTCVEQINEKDEGPYYTHLGSGPTVASIRVLMEERYGEKGKAIRIEKVIYTGKEGKSSRGCPIAKWVIRRQSEEEKLLCLVRHRAGHHCENAVIIILIMAWEGITRSLGDTLYQDITETITKHGNPTSRRCGLNDDRTCACQGKDPNTCGASFSFGCSWSMYFNGCKYARSKTPRKFRLSGDNPKEEEILKGSFQNLATKVAPLYKRLAPQAYENQVTNENIAIDCRLGEKEGRPFSGVTACMDFCAHAHKDQHNLYNGCTVVCTLTKEDNRKVGKIPEDEQLHVLPLYKVSNTDEFGNEEAQAEKIKLGGIQVLTSFPREVRKLPEPAKSCRQRQMEAKKAAAEKKKLQKEKLLTPDKVKQEPAETLKSPGMPQQQVKPCVKVEPSSHYNNYKYNSNGVVESYSVLGNCRPSDPYSMNSVYSYHSFYAQPNLPSMNGFHSKFALPSFGYYGYSSNHMVPSQFMNYGATDPRSGGWMSNAFEKKPDLQSLADSTNHGYMNDLSDQGYVRSSEISHQYGLHDHNQKSVSIPHRTTPAPMDTTSYSQNISCFSKVIKKEPISDMSKDSFQRVPSVHAQRPGVNLSLQNSDHSISYKANGALSSSERTNMDRSCNRFMYNEKVSLPSGLEKRDYFGLQANGIGMKNLHGPDKWNSYGNDGHAAQCDSPSSGKVWSSCKLSESPKVLPSSASTQEKNWHSGSANLNQAVKQNTMLQEKLWNAVGANDRNSMTHSIGVQDKTWNMFTSPAVKSLKTNNGIPGGEQHENMWDPYSIDDNIEETPTKSMKEEDEEEIWSDSEHNFLDSNIGGVAVAPAHGSILIECARRELHATTPLKQPNRCHPTRISLVFYQHKNLNQPNHGLALWEAKMKLLAERTRARQEEAARLGIKEEVKGFGKKRKWGGATTTETPPVEKKDFIATRQAATLITNSATTASSYAYTKVTGPYSRWI